MPSFKQCLLTFVFALAASATSLAQTSDVKIVNPASSPVLTKIVNAAGAPVQTRIVNPTAAPVPVKVVDEAAREPFQKSLSINGSTDNSTFTVPTNRRLVIEFVTAHFGEPVDVKIVLVKLTTQLTTGSAALNHFFVPHFQGTRQGGGINQFTTDEYAVSQQARIYAGPGTQVKFAFDLSVQSPTFRSGSMTISGYLEPVAGVSAASAPASATDGAQADWESPNE